MVSVKVVGLQLFQSHYRSDFNTEIKDSKKLRETNFNPIIGLILTLIILSCTVIDIFQSHYRSDFNTLT